MELTTFRPCHITFDNASYKVKNPLYKVLLTKWTFLEVACTNNSYDKSINCYDIAGTAQQYNPVRVRVYPDGCLEGRKKPAKAICLCSSLCNSRSADYSQRDCWALHESSSSSNIYLEATKVKAKREERE